MDFMENTLRYYSKWLGEEDILLKKKMPGVYPVYSPERSRVQYGYGEVFDLYVLVRDGQIFFSYGERMKERIDSIADGLKECTDGAAAASVLEEALKVRPSRYIKYVFGGGIPEHTKARPLTVEEYPLYEDFFVKCNPGCRNIDWLQEYFDEMAAERICCGYLLNGEVVSCTDAPGMPYMAAEMQEVGINTLSAYRGCGYAGEVCAACIREIVRNGKTPLWSTTAENMASRRLAEKMGFSALAEVLTVSL